MTQLGKDLGRSGLSLVKSTVSVNKLPWDLHMSAKYGVLPDGCYTQARRTEGHVVVELTKLDSVSPILHQPRCFIHGYWGG